MTAPLYDIVVPTMARPTLAPLVAALLRESQGHAGRVILVDDRSEPSDLPVGPDVMADERFFVVKADNTAVSSERWTALEREVMTEHRWWSRAELAQTKDVVFPENLLEMLAPFV